MSESAEGSPGPSGPAIPLFEGEVKFGKYLPGAVDPVAVWTFDSDLLVARFLFRWDDSKRILEAGLRAMEAQHVDVVRNGNGKLWKPNG